MKALNTMCDENEIEMEGNKLAPSDHDFQVSDYVD